jgi:hypothetical protein
MPSVSTISKHNQWHQQPKCECQETGYGPYILTLQDGTVHGPAPSPLPKDEDCVTISGDEVKDILDGMDKKDPQ